MVAVVPTDGPREIEGADVVVEGGSTRAGSVRAGLAVVPSDAEVILVHDAARPLASAELFAPCRGRGEGRCGGRDPGRRGRGLASRADGGPVDRDRLVAVQTPQAFAAAALRAAHAAGAEATDDATVVEAAGGAVVVVPGERWNLKITEPDDLLVAAALLDRGAAS